MRGADEQPGSMFSYISLFARFPLTRDFPWVNLLLLAAGLALLGAGVVRAFRKPQLYRGRIFGSALALLGLGLFALLALAINVTMFALIYKFLPNARTTWRQSFAGGLVAGVLWEVAKYVFAWALNYFHYDQIYGSVGAVVAVLTWSYVSSLILLFGAQLTAVFHREHPHYPAPPQLPATS